MIVIVAVDSFVMLGVADIAEVVDTIAGVADMIAVVGNVVAAGNVVIVDTEHDVVAVVVVEELELVAGCTADAYAAVAAGGILAVGVVVEAGSVVVADIEVDGAEEVEHAAFVMVEHVVVLAMKVAAVVTVMYALYDHLSLVYSFFFLEW